VKVLFLALAASFCRAAPGAPATLVSFPSIETDSNDIFVKTFPNYYKTLENQITVKEDWVSIDSVPIYTKT
jgi:hypothetical protein